MDNLIANLLLCAGALFIFWGIGLIVAALHASDDGFCDDDDELAIRAQKEK